MALGTWWRGDILPELPPLQSFSAHISTDTTLIANMNDLSVQAVEARMHSGNDPYVAYIGETPVAYGWFAIQNAGVREIQLSFTLPPHNSYLWDFQTLPEWRGRGIYPHFLQAILQTRNGRSGAFLDTLQTWRNCRRKEYS